MDSFFGQTTEQMVTAASAAGFTFATKSDVHELLDSLPLTGNEWVDIYKPIMMDAPNRELIWGSYQDGDANPLLGWAFAYDYDTSWNVLDNRVAANSIPNMGSVYADMNIWAYKAVPEPGTLFLLGFGLSMLGIGRKQFRSRCISGNDA